VTRKVLPIEVLVAHLTLDHHFWTVSLDVIEELMSGHVLEPFVEADIAAELWAVVDGMIRELTMCLPEHLTISIFVTFMRELAKVDAVLHQGIDWLQEVASCITTWAFSFSDVGHIHSLLRRGVHL